MPNLDIVVLTFERAPLLRRCLDSLDAASKVAEAKTRVIIVINGIDPSSVLEIESARRRLLHLEIESIQSNERLPCGFARNAGVERASADWIYFADDDAWVAPDFLTTFFSFIETNPEISVVGGPNLTSPEMTEFQKIAGAVLGSWFAAGPFSRRYRAGGTVTVVDDDRSLILCNLFIARNALSGYRFPEGLSCAEENHMLHFLNAHQSAFHPSLSVSHERARGFKKFASSVIRYGRGRGELLALQGFSLKTSRMISLAFVLALALVMAAPRPALLVYLSSSILHSLVLAARLRSWRAISDAFLLTAVLHFFYPIGVARGLIEGLIAPTRSLVLARVARRSRSRDR